MALDIDLTVFYLISCRFEDRAVLDVSYWPENDLIAIVQPDGTFSTQVLRDNSSDIKVRIYSLKNWDKFMVRNNQSGHCLYLNAQKQERFCLSAPTIINNGKVQNRCILPAVGSVSFKQHFEDWNKCYVPSHWLAVCGEDGRLYVCRHTGSCHCKEEKSEKPCNVVHS